MICLSDRRRVCEGLHASTHASKRQRRRLAHTSTFSPFEVLDKSWRMRVAIEEKLRRQFSSKAPFTEMRVVYILVETRKLLERQGELNRYPALRFYCDWALHTSMDRAGAQRILRLFDEAHPLLCANQELPRPLRHDITETTNLRYFERDYEQFLTDYNLPQDILHCRWTKFLHSYAAVIEDCPLTVRANNLGTLRA